jgi:Major Facilitator Superfamily
LNVPVGIALAAAILARVPADAAPTAAGGSRADIAGAVALTAGLMAIAFGVHESIGHGWLAAATLGPILGGLALLAGFLLHESRSRRPLIPLATLRKPSLAFASLSAALLWACFLGLIYEATIFVQEVQGWAPLAASSSTIPIAVFSLAVSAFLAPRLMGRFGAAPTLAAGLVIMALGLAGLARVPDHVSYLADLALPYSVVGIGLGLAQVAVQIAAFAGISKDEAGLAGGALETSRELGGAIGLALLVSIALSGATSGTDAFHRATVAAAGFAVLGALIAATLLRRVEQASTNV